MSGGLTLPTEPAGRTHVYHQYTVRVREDAIVTRDELARHLQHRGVQTGVYYPRPVFDHACFRRDARVETPPVPRTVRAGREALSLPVHPGIGLEDIETIVGSIREIMH